ncbi:MAG TPA: homoserine dehydrogenase [Thermogutta sp.]|mgnify:CR=1 FL=1|nr:homoserine dehydrogenase [Thermogutta sp.]HPU06827.1 homoserine dehydrogenase [Thermogutta sp.]HQF12911.1 homoserine dehydrogenase [Thermogutta sp.]
MDSLKVAIIGFGTIGSGVAKLLLEHGDRIARRAGRPIELVRIVDKDLVRPRNVTVPKHLLTDDLDAVIKDPNIAVAVELIGGVEPTRSIVLSLLEHGKDVVTANKALLAEHGPELFEAARRLGRSISFEAAVAGGIPIIAAIGESLTANEITSIHAILNGTSNFILTQMEERGQEYAAALAEAQRLGYAEANPSMDVSGADAAQKLAILAQLAFGAQINWRDIPRVGIDTVQAEDMRYARELGYHIRLLAVAELIDGELELHVSPTLVREGTPLGEVRGAYNAVRVVGDAVGRVFFHGLGAGQMPTASAVVADIIDTAVGRAAITFRTLRLWSNDGPHIGLRNPDMARSRFYLRFHVQDRPGVLAEIAGILGRNQISIASVIQHQTEEETEGVVPLVIMTHTAAEGPMRKAMAEIDRLPVVRPGSVWMRVRD